MPRRSLPLSAGQCPALPSATHFDKLLWMHLAWGWGKCHQKRHHRDCLWTPLICGKWSNSDIHVACELGFPQRASWKTLKRDLGFMFWHTGTYCIFTQYRLSALILKVACRTCNVALKEWMCSCLTDRNINRLLRFRLLSDLGGLPGFVSDKHIWFVFWRERRVLGGQV